MKYREGDREMTSLLRFAVFYVTEICIVSSGYQYRQSFLARYMLFFLQDEVVLDCRFATEESTKDYFFEKKKKKRALLLWIARWKLSGNFLNFLFGWLIAKPEIMS